jgi:heme-degrading monooxygenase HmoA
VFARSTSINAQPSMIDGGIAYVSDTVMPALSHLNGYLGLSVLVDHESGRGIVTTAWRAEDAKIEDLPGFCSASLFVNRADGRAVTTVGYDDRSSLEYSREGANAVREQAASQMDAHILEVAEFELALAHLHVPEMV